MKKVPTWSRTRQDRSNRRHLELVNGAQDQERERIRAEVAAEAQRQLTAAQWTVSLARLGVPVLPVSWKHSAPCTLTSQEVAAVWWLPESNQCLVAGTEMSESFRADVEHLQHALPARVGCDPETRTDLRVIAGLPDGRFFSPMTHSVALVQCGACSGWYFCDDAGSWRCQADQCVYTDNADLAEMILDGIPRDVWPRLERPERMAV